MAACGWYSTPATAQEHASELNKELNAGIEIFRWQEFDAGGTRLLTESGPRLFIAAAINNTDNVKQGFFYEAIARGYTGNVDYDGQDSNGIFTSSRTTYSGFGLQLNGGFRVIGRIDVDMLAGVGLDTWRREIKDDENALGNVVSGITEDYSIQYITLAMGLPQRFSNAEGYLKIGLKRPFSTNEDVDDFNVSLSPGKKLSAIASYKVIFDENGKNLISSIMFYYDSFRFSKSQDKVTVVGGVPIQVRQPESSMDMIGVAIGHTF